MMDRGDALSIIQGITVRRAIKNKKIKRTAKKYD